MEEFAALSFDVGIVKDATVPAISESSPPTPESVQGFHVPPDNSNGSSREMLLRRYTAPFPCEPPYRRWGINE